MVSTENVDMVVNAPSKPTPNSSACGSDRAFESAQGGHRTQQQGADQIHAQRGPRKVGVGHGFADVEPQHGAQGAPESDQHPI